MTPKHALKYPQKQDAGRAQFRPPGATMGGPVPNGPQSQAWASSGRCPASSTTLSLEEDPRPSRAEARQSLRLPRFQDLPKTSSSGLIPIFFRFPDRVPVGFYPWSRSYLGPAYARIGEASTSFPVPQRARCREAVRLPCVCQTPPGGPDRAFPASRPSRGVVSCVALGLPGHPPKGAVPRYPPRGVLRDWSRPVTGSCRWPCHP